MTPPHSPDKRDLSFRYATNGYSLAMRTIDGTNKRVDVENDQAQAVSTLFNACRSSSIDRFYLFCMVADSINANLLEGFIQHELNMREISFAMGVWRMLLLWDFCSGL